METLIYFIGVIMGYCLHIVISHIGREPDNKTNDTSEIKHASDVLSYDYAMEKAGLSDHIIARTVKYADGTVKVSKYIGSVTVWREYPSFKSIDDYSLIRTLCDQEKRLEYLNNQESK